MNMWELLLGSSLISGAVLYFAWADVRVIFLRQELFTIRDQLWNIAKKNNALSDPAYRQARECLNGWIRISDLLIAPVIDRHSAKLKSSTTVRKIKSPDVALQAAIDNAYAASAKAIVRYVYLYSASGWITLARNALRHRVRQTLAAPQELSRKSVSKWLNSDVPRELDRMKMREESYKERPRSMAGAGA